MSGKNEALKRLLVVESFRLAKTWNKTEGMFIKIVRHTPGVRPVYPWRRPFCHSDSTTHRRSSSATPPHGLIDIKAHEVIMRNEKRMLQEAVESLFTTPQSSAVKTDANRP
jgi:DNA-directed RNA polymerase subunit beta'